MFTLRMALYDSTNCTPQKSNMTQILWTVAYFLLRLSQ